MAERAARQRRSVESAEQNARAAEAAAQRAERAAEAAARDLKAARQLLEEARKILDEARRQGRPPGNGSGQGLRREKPTAGASRVLRVGPGRPLTTPSAAARVARRGDVIEIDATTYAGDVAVWSADDLTIRGIGGRPHLLAGGRSAQGKAIWVIRGRNTTIENMEFSGARVPDGNGAGIRQEGPGLVIRNAYFHDNQTGILTGSNADSRILIEYSEFARNGSGNGYTHNIYIGRIAELTVRFSYLHHAPVGHNLKSRARRNLIAYNRIMDESSGNASYQIDLSDGGTGILIGNIIQQGARAENWAIVSFAAERSGADDRLYLIHNTLVNDRSPGLFVWNRSKSAALIVNNIFAGKGQTLKGPGTMTGNLIARLVRRTRSGFAGWARGKPARIRSKKSADGNFVADRVGFTDPDKFDYRPIGGSPARDAATAPVSVDGARLIPEFEYRHPTARRPRVRVGPPDIGALEATAR